MKDETYWAKTGLPKRVGRSEAVESIAVLITEVDAHAHLMGKQGVNEDTVRNLIKQAAERVGYAVIDTRAMKEA